MVGAGAAGVAVAGICAVAVIVGNSGVTVAVGGEIVAEGEIDGLGVIVAVALGVTVTITGVTGGGGSARHPRPTAIRASPAATRISTATSRLP